MSQRPVASMITDWVSLKTFDRMDTIIADIKYPLNVMVLARLIVNQEYYNNLKHFQNTLKPYLLENDCYSGQKKK